MATLSQVITRAYRESQIIDAEETPSAIQVTEALDLLRGIIARSFVQVPQITVYYDGNQTIGAGKIRRQFVNLGTNNPIPENISLHCNLTVARTLKMPYSPGDGARLRIIDVARNFATFNLTLEGNGQQIDTLPSLTLATDGQNAEFFYRRDLAGWVTVTQLTEGQNMPFPEEFDDKFVIELAGRLNPRYGNELPAVTFELWRQMNERFRARYSRDVSAVEPDQLFGPEPFGGYKYGYGYGRVR